MTTTKKQKPRERPAATGIVAGFNKGYKTTRRPRPVARYARLGLPKPKLRAVKDLIADCLGNTPMESRTQELMRNGKEKRALKFLRKRLGSLKAAKKKRARMEEAIRKKK